MKKSDRVKRAVAFYISLTVFFFLLPVVLSYSLGYHIDFRMSRIYKTGIIFIDSRPAGALVYVNGREYPGLTPVQIEELKPGSYRVEVRREGFYPWEKDLIVRPNMVTKAEKIVLFPTTQDMKRVCGLEVSDFLVSNRNYIYYFAPSGLYRSGMDGSPLKKLCGYSNWPKGMIGKKFSPDGAKILYFNDSVIGVVYLNPEAPLIRGENGARVEEVLTGLEGIIDAFWHSGSGYLVVVTRKDIKVAELRGGEKYNIVSLYKFNAHPQGVAYDDSSDSLYFTDIKHDMNEPRMRFLYRLDLRQKFFESLMKLLLRKESEADHEKI